MAIPRQHVRVHTYQTWSVRSCNYTDRYYPVCHPKWELISIPYRRCTMPPLQFTSLHFESWSRVDPHELPESNDLAQKLFLASNDPILLLNPTAGEFLGVYPRGSVFFG